MSAAETDEKTLPMTDTHYAVSISRISPAPHDCKPVREKRS